MGLKVSLVWLGAILSSAALMHARPVSAVQESCDQCKYLQCLRANVERKRSLVRVYGSLRDYWKTRDKGESVVAARDLSKLPEPERSRVYRETLEQLSDYGKMERQRIDAVGIVQDCDSTVSEKSISTDSFEFCWTQGLNEAVQRQSCRELAELMEVHEGMLAKACFKRQEPRRDYWPYIVEASDGGKIKKLLPPKIATPFGMATNEIEAYEFEISSLVGLIKKLEKNCGKR